MKADAKEEAFINAMKLATQTKDEPAQEDAFSIFSPHIWSFGKKAVKTSAPVSDPGGESNAGNGAGPSQGYGGPANSGYIGVMPAGAPMSAPPALNTQPPVPTFRFQNGKISPIQ